MIFFVLRWISLMMMEFMRHPDFPSGDGFSAAFGGSSRWNLPRERLVWVGDDVGFYFWLFICAVWGYAIGFWFWWLWFFMPIVDLFRSPIAWCLGILAAMIVDHWLSFSANVSIITRMRYKWTLLLSWVLLQSRRTRVVVILYGFYMWLLILHFLKFPFHFVYCIISRWK